MKAFIETFDTDILIIQKCSNFCGVSYPVQFAELAESHSLSQYDILIFDPKFNYLNKYNVGFNGKQFNGKHKGAYLLRKKKYRTQAFRLNLYSVVFHIFLFCHDQFNQRYKYPRNRQIIHLYPGGGYRDLRCINKIPRQTKIISTQAFTKDYITQVTHHRFIDVPTGPYVDKGEQMPEKSFKPIEEAMKICFTSLGDPKIKGAHIYIQVVNLYKIKYPTDHVVFYSIGNGSPNNHVIQKSPMPQHVIDKFYEEEIDILFNLQHGLKICGFPHGTEGLIRGCILFTTDEHNLSHRNGFHFEPEVQIINHQNISDIVDRLHNLYIDRNRMYEMSRLSQRKALDLFGYDNTMQKILDFVTTVGTT
jgi:hypothetical protein